MTQPTKCGAQELTLTSQDTISVVIPLYNKCPHIAKTIESILSQSVLPTEIIVVDDGSTDGSADVVKRYKEHNVQLISQENEGVSAARNRGIATSTSVWIAFLDADDLWLPNHIEALQTAIHSYPDVGLVSTQYEILQDGERVRPPQAYSGGIVCRVDDFYRRFVTGHSLINSSTACAKREAILSIGGFPVNVQIGEDIIVWIKLFEQFGMAHIAEVSSVWFRDAVNRSTSITSVMPESLVFLGEMLKRRSGIQSGCYRSMALMFDSMACVTAAGRKLQGDIATVDRIRRACWHYGRGFAWMAIAILAVVPIPVLLLVRRWRRAGHGHSN